jgi:hypothetical protein
VVWLETSPMRSTCLPVLLLLVGTADPAREDTPSALASSPEGWTDLLAEAGPELKGWTRLPIPPTGKLKPESQWSLDPNTGILLCRGDGGHEWLRWDKPVSDAIFHVEWKFAKVEGKKGYNAGVFARNSADAEIWHQAQTGDGNGGYLFGNSPVDGKPARFNLSKPPRDRREKPPGEWNTYEIRCRGKEITLWVNGADVSTYKTCEVPKGYVGLEAEGWRIEFRNVKLKTLAP